MGVNSLPTTVTLQRRGCDLNPGPQFTYRPTSMSLWIKDAKKLFYVHPDNVVMKFTEF